MTNKKELHPLAEELNKVLDTSIAGAFLSDLGRRFYFPKGIIAQSGEAKQFGKTANATIGMAFKNGKPLMFSSLQEQVPALSPQETVAYAPTAGNDELRSLWLSKIREKNPSLNGCYVTLPVLVPGLTAGITYLSELFLDENSCLLTGSPAWDNYVLVVETRRNSTLKGFSMFNGTGFNIESFKKATNEEAKTGKVSVLLNFPQNPSGYSPTKDEVALIVNHIKELAESETKIMVWCDDAYFGLNYEETIDSESLFGKLAHIHENVLAVKIDGPTKEDYVWGLRAGFLTFASKGLTEQTGEALIKKLMGAIRSSVSCSSTPSQSLMLKILNDPRLENEKRKNKELLQERYQIVRKFIDSHTDHPVLQALPFNSGYFMSLKCNGVHAEDLRLKLLHDHGIGTIAIDEHHLRIAFSSVDTEKIEALYTTLFAVAKELKE